MEAVLIANWNAAVGPDDEVWHLGDFARGGKRAAAVLPRLHGTKHLILGNLDDDADLVHGWADIQAYAEIELDRQGLVLCHYPFRSWNGMHRGWLNLHGHSHGRLKPLARQVDVGVDAHGFQPVRLAELLAGRRYGRRNLVESGIDR
jgi:calcineurin-like phosphoesterase family protein